MTGLHLFSKPLLEERREEKQQAMRERVLLSLQSFDMKNVRNVDLEYKGEVPMDFNMLNMAQHEDILRQTCQIMKEKSAQICYR